MIDGLNKIFFSINSKSFMDSFDSFYIVLMSTLDGYLRSAAMYIKMLLTMINVVGVAFLILKY